MQVAAVIVLYNPDSEVWPNIYQCSSQVEKVYLIDNSESPGAYLGHESDTANIFYFWNGGNRGIAYALNRGAEIALSDGYTYLLTLDQDSFPEDGMVKTLLDSFSVINGSIGIVAPGELVGVDLNAAVTGKPFQVQTVWTSGNLLNLDAYRLVGAFRDDLFIDFVDHEYCLRLNKSGYGVFRVPGARLRHCLGVNSWRIVLFGRSFWVTNHAPLRRYYIMRNRLLVRSLYIDEFPKFFRKDRLFMVLEILAVLFFEKKKWEKILMLNRGVRDFKSGYFGKYNG